MGEDPDRVRTVSARRTGEQKRRQAPADLGRALNEELSKPPWVRLRSDGEISAGGMGAVEAVVDDVLQRRLARKLILPELQQREATLQMFVREAQITGRLAHPNIVPVHDIGYAPSGRLYFTMQLVRGETLSERIQTSDTASLDRGELFSLLEVVMKVCDALAFAHSHGVVHCDVKPENIMVGDFGQVYMMDWGVAHVVGGGDREFPAPLGLAAGELDDMILGTPQYMAPEQATGPRTALDARADVFAVGAVLYEVLTKRAPYACENPQLALLRAQTGDVIPIAEVVGKGAVPPALVRIVERALAFDREDRYPTVTALRTALAHFVRGDGEFSRITVGPGELIVREGDSGDAAFIIESGACEVYQHTDGERTVLRRLGPGDVFGEAAILSPGPRTASVAAVAPTTLMVVTRDVLDEEVGVLKPWLAALLRCLATRFREVDAERRAYRDRLDRE